MVGPIGNTVVELPYRATVQEALPLMEVCQRIERDAELRTIDATSCERFGPFGTTLLATAIAKRALAGLPPLEFLAPASPEVQKFLDEVRFNRFLNYPPVPESVPGSIRELRHLTALNPMYIEDVATMIADRVPGTTEDAAHYIQLCLNELVQNVFEHAHSQIGCFVHARWYAGDRNVRLAVVDGGIGIPAALRREVHLALYRGQDTDLIVDAVTKHGLTSRKTQVGGLGLKHIHDIVTRHGGKLVVISYRAKVEFAAARKPRRSSRASFRGTAIEIDFRPYREDPVSGDQ